MPKHSVMLWSISTRPLCHVDSMNTQLDSLNNGHTHQSGLVITRTYHGSNTNLWATWQPGSSTLGGAIQVDAWVAFPR
jgi:hypothetical protein